MSYDAGALIFKIQTAGQQTFESEMAAADRSVEKLGRTSSESTPKVERVGTAVDQTGKKAKDAKAPLDEQAKSTKKVGDESEDAAKKQRNQKVSTEEQIAAAKELSAVLLVAGAATTALVALSVAKYTEFDKAMSQTRAATMATAEEQRVLGEAALEAGADTAYSASEAAAAEEELAKAGQSVSDIVGGSLNGALALAAAGQLEVARSAEIMATTLTQFKLPASDAARVSDVLAAGAGKAQGSVDDLALALSYVGPLANQAGWSVEETGGAIAYFASQGILGEKAGTSLRGVLAALQSPSAIAKRTMDEYGISIYDAQGNMLGAAGVADQLKNAFNGLAKEERDAAMGRIFGNESLLAATLPYDGGAAAISEWTDAVDDSGYAAEQAAMRQDNLAGDIEKLGGAFDTALIRTGAPANDVLREMVQAITALVDFYGELPAPVHTAGLVIGAAAGAALLFAGAAVQVRARLMELQVEFNKTNTSMRRTALVGAGAGIALAGITTVIGILLAKQADMNAATAEYADTLDDATGATTEYTRETIARKLAESGAFEGARQAGVSQRELTDALYEGGDAYETVMEKLRGAHDASGGFNAQIGNTINAMKDTNVQLGDAKQRHEDLKAATEESTTATGDNAASTESAAAAYISAASGAEDLENELRELIDTINEANGVGQNAISANVDYQDALRAVDEQIQKVRDGEEGHAATLDISTEAGARNMEMLVGLASDAQKAADAQFALDGNTDAYRATLEASRQALIDRARDLGATEDEARALADQIFRIPSDTEWTMIADTAAARRELNGFFTSYNGRRINVTVDAVGGKTYQIAGTSVKYQADGGKIEFFADGGRSENHVAQFARAGTYRVWAEPETGGEWYLPDSPAKRSRSVTIAEQMLAGWGYAMVPVGAQRFADGSPAQSSYGGTPLTVEALARLLAEHPRMQIVQQYPIHTDPIGDAIEAADTYNAGV